MIPRPVGRSRGSSNTAWTKANMATLKRYLRRKMSLSKCWVMTDSYGLGRSKFGCAHGTNWTDMAKNTVWADRGQPRRAADPLQDVHGIFTIMWDQWNDVFSKHLGRADRTLISELRDVRNRWAHQEPFSTDDAYRALDSTHR